MYVSGAVLSQGIAFLLFPFLSRALSPRDYGIIDLLGLLTVTVNLLVAAPLQSALGRYFVETSDLAGRRAYASTALAVNLTAYSAFVAAGLVFVRPLTTLVLGAGVDTAIMKVGLATIWFSGMLTLSQSVLRWQLRPGAFAAVAITSAGVMTATSAALVLSLDTGVIGAIAGQLVGFATAAVLAFWLGRGLYRFQLDRAKLKRMLAYGVPLVPASAGVFLYGYADRIAIKSQGTLTDVGVYGTGYRFSVIVSLTLIGFQGALQPLVLSRHTEAETRLALARIFRLFCAVALAVYLLVSVFADEILRLLAPPAYHGATLVVPLLVAAAFFGGMVIFAPGLQIVKRTGLYGGTILFFGVVNAILAFAFFAPMGIRGPALAYLLGCAGGFAAVMYLSQRVYPVPHAWARIVPSSLAVTGLVVIARALFAGADNPGTTAAKLALSIGGLTVIWWLLLLGPGRTERASASPTACSKSSSFASAHSSVAAR